MKIKRRLDKVEKEANAEVNDTKHYTWMPTVKIDGKPLEYDIGEKVKKDSAKEWKGKVMKTVTFED